MNQKALRTLEFNKIIEQLKTYALTEPGQQRCAGLVPYDRIEQVERAQHETEEALLVLLRRGDNPLIPFKDISGWLSLARKGSTLPPRALLDTAELLRAAAASRNALVRDEEERTPQLTALASRLAPLRPLERAISDALISEEEVADTASAQLADIRRHMRQCNERIRERLQAIAHGSSSKYLQDSLITMRNGRYVLPVRQEFRSQVPGLVHDQSATGATLFIEPMAVVEAGNELKEWQAKERVEIERILAELSANVGDQADEVAENLEILVEMDFRFAKAALARRQRAIRPQINRRGYLKFVKVRHPLIPDEVVVPCDLWLGEGFTTLVITGPNTGGKTVTLKTVGLITLMALAGLHVPGQLGTQVAMFERVFADIGDEQSIEQSLSTFSSHMTNIVSILEEAGKEDLVLFDELGAGTDPTEGAALAQAILQRMLKLGTRCVATTHYSELKAFALATPGAENASVEFDVATLSPTYRLSIGVPGKSNAFEISRRLGLSDRLIADAQELLSKETLLFEDVIASAQDQRQAAQREREQAEAAHQESLRLKREVQELHREMAALREGARAKARDEAKRIVEKARRESAAVLEELKNLKAADPNAINELRRRMRALGDEFSGGLDSGATGDELSAQDIQVNMQVLLAVNNAPATVLSLPDAKDEVQVQAGILKMRVPVNQLRPASQQRAQKQTVVRANTGAGERSVKMECDVRGMALDEAMAAVDNYLDSATLAGLHEVFIIHGKGTGTLRAGLRTHLKRHHLVASQRAGKYGEGETGVTVVTLK
ncbi:MAG TPA: endonuclease MutS2 [Clostridia bacterium]|jgi:DNA mismatch repair protein MutS2|nr:endonuclease MutS2 [Clostridia bacterium]HPY42888.1 endonuclease MutS2 [Clostridia bacterium]HQO54871.1 endonuclease MutS2 [Clostridia bacterium]HUM60936.1 endonuclease MutS2 [Clostridia bacterium]